MHRTDSEYCHFLLFSILRESEDLKLVSFRLSHFFFFLLSFNSLNSAVSIVMISILGRACLHDMFTQEYL